MSKKLVIVESGVGTVVTSDWTGISTLLNDNEVLLARDNVTYSEILEDNDMLICKKINVGTIENPIYRFRITKLVAPVDPLDNKVLTFDITKDPNVDETNLAWLDSSVVPIAGDPNSVLILNKDGNVDSIPFLTAGSSLTAKEVDGDLELSVESFGGATARGMVVKTGDATAPLACTSVGTTDASTADKIIVSDNTTAVIKAFDAPALAVPYGKADDNGGIAFSNSANPAEIQIFQNVEGAVKFQ